MKGVAFNRWHHNYTHRPDASLIESADNRVLLWTAKGECLGNATCLRNFRAGNRKERECTACPLREFISSKAARAQHLLQIDTIHQFYEMLGIRGERHLGAFERFHVRQTHWEVLYAAFQNSKRLPTGYMDTRQQTFLSVGTLLKTLILDLVSRPLGSPSER